MNVYIKNTYSQVDRKIFTIDSCSNCKLYLSRPKEQMHKKGLESSVAPCIFYILKLTPTRYSKSKLI